MQTTSSAGCSPAPQTQGAMTGILSGVRVLDLSTVIAGPFATQMLGDLGADIIKVERPGGDGVRMTGCGKHAGMSGLFLNNNRNKRSIVLDLKNAKGRAALLRLASTCDVVIHNVRPAAMRRLSLTYDDFVAVNPRIIHVNIVGYGQDGPYAAYPAYDDMIQAAVALPSLLHAAGASEPRYMPIVVADRITSYVAVNAVLAGLIRCRQQDGGQDIEVGMFEAMAQMVLGDHLGGRTFDPPIGLAGYERLMSPHRHPFRTLDGAICALIYNDANWRDFLKLADRADLFDKDPRLATLEQRTAHIDELYRLAASIFATRTSAEWLALLRDNDIPAMPYISLDDLCDDPHLLQTGAVRFREHKTEGTVRSVAPPLRWRGEAPFEETRGAPALGEHGAEVLAEAGFSAEEVAELVDAGSVPLSRTPTPVA